MTTRLEIYGRNGNHYLTYTFRHHKPHAKCRVARRGQPSPSAHTVSIVVDGEKIVDRSPGFVLPRNGQVDLPTQTLGDTIPQQLTTYNINEHPTAASLPAKVWKQYGSTRVLWQKKSHYIPMRDWCHDGSANVYLPTRVVVA